MPELSTIYDYMRANASLLGARILQEYPALHQFDDPVSPRVEDLLRKPFPAQTIAIMGVVKRPAAGANSDGGCGRPDGQDSDLAGSHSCPQPKKSIHCFSDGS